MKLLCIIALTACLISQSAQVPNAILSSGTVEANVKDTQYDLKIVAPFEESEKQGEHMIEIYQEPKSVNSVIQAILDKIKDLIENGFDDIPSLDPLVVGKIGPVDLDTITFTGEVTVHKLTVFGHSKNKVDRINLKPQELAAGIGFVNRKVTLTGRYEASSKVGLVTLTGEGDVELVAENCKISVDMIMGVNKEDKHLYLKELDIHIGIEDIKIKIANQTGSPTINSLISVTIQTASETLIKSQLPLLSKFLSTTLFNIINNILKEFTFKDIFGYNEYKEEIPMKIIL